MWLQCEVGPNLHPQVLPATVLASWHRRSVRSVSCSARETKFACQRDVSLRFQTTLTLRFFRCVCCSAWESEIAILKFYLWDVSMGCGHPSAPVGVESVFRGFHRFDVVMMVWYVVWFGMIQEVNFVWAAITPFLLARRREENTALIRCSLIAWYAHRVCRDCWIRGYGTTCPSLSLLHQGTTKDIVRWYWRHCSDGYVLLRPILLRPIST